MACDCHTCGILLTAGPAISVNNFAFNFLCDGLEKLIGMVTK